MAALSSSAISGRKRQQQICFRSLALPSTSVDEGSDPIANVATPPKYCPHFLAAMQLMAHTLIPVRKALIHFYVSYRGKDSVDKLEWKMLLSFGRLCRNLITASDSSGNSSTNYSMNGDGGDASVSNHSDDPSMANHLPPVSSDAFYAVLYECLPKQKLSPWPKDVTHALRVLLQCLQSCCRTLPVTSQLWSALLDKACMGLIVKQTLVGLRKKPLEGETDVLQRSLTERCILWCPHELSMEDLTRISNPSSNDGEEEAVPTLQQLLEEDFKKRPLSTTTRKHYDFEKQAYDFEVKIPTKFLNNAKDDDNNEELWKTTRAMKFASLTGYLFLGIDRIPKENASKLNRSELAIPPTLDLTKLCAISNGGKKTGPVKYDLVGGALYDDGDYVAVLKDHAKAAESAEQKQTEESEHNEGDSNDDEDDETWKLMEAEETIAMGEMDILEFLKGEGNEDDEESDDDDDDSDDGGSPFGTMAVYRLRPAPNQSKSIHDEMDELLSDIVISQISGSLSSKTDYYIEEEIYEEVIEDEED